MDFGQQRLQQQEAARQMMYQNQGYQFERRDKKTLIVDVADSGTDNPLSTATEFSVDLFEPLIIDKLSDVYLDNFTTYNSLLCDKNDRSTFSLSINEFNVNSNVASSGGGQNMFNKVLIPNEHNNVDNAYSAVIHKGKKMNYVCSINPGRLSNISGKISDLGGSSMFSTGNGADGGKLYSVTLDNPATKAVPAGTEFGFNGGISGGSASTGFKTAYAMKKNSPDLYFYSTGATVTDLSTSREISSATDLGLGEIGVTTLTTSVNTFRAGSFPRFTAEFVIVARV
jgi:hypothetical protein